MDRKLVKLDPMTELRRSNEDEKRNLEPRLKSVSLDQRRRLLADLKEEQQMKFDELLAHRDKPDKPTAIDHQYAVKYEQKVDGWLADLRNHPIASKLIPEGYDPFYARGAHLLDSAARNDCKMYLDRYALGVNSKEEPVWNWAEIAPNNGVHWDNEVRTTLEVGTVIDRWGPRVKEAKYDTGTYICPSDTPFERAGIPPSNLAQFQRYRVCKLMHVLRSEVTPGAVGTLGRGGQYRLQVPLGKYVDRGFLEPIGPPFGRSRE
ncbi:TNT domain-containing protein [Microlunatus capsulatus]|uniref:TNT domain-containing protein n=1 Tax=Microlunatus capsulatus TaxID=99117 RepID=A0ABS4Z822_9ACTN|nr:TNT domain-containing protein [Microlunatus capsulatus]MBP2417188.1 hypothetical protein [Microlunatus capsulatus]